LKILTDGTAVSYPPRPDVSHFANFELFSRKPELCNSMKIARKKLEIMLLLRKLLEKPFQFGMRILIHRSDDRPETAKKYGQRKNAATTRLKVQQDLKLQRFEEGKASLQLIQFFFFVYSVETQRIE
jgi:hypothetical protein